MRKTIMMGLAALAIALLPACGGADDPADSAGNTPAPAESQAPAGRSAAPEPTRPQRIDDLLTPTAEPEPTEETQAREMSAENAGGPDAGQNGADGDQNAVMVDPSKLLPEEPRFNDEVLLQDIYDRMDLEQFALDPSGPVELVEGESLKDHPFLYLIPHAYEMSRMEYLTDETRFLEPMWIGMPDLENIVTPKSRTRPDDSPAGYSRENDIAATRGPITYFLHHPWFEPVFMTDAAARSTHHPNVRARSEYRWEAGPYWFGENSIRGVLADTVEKLMEDAMVPDAGTLPRLWWKEAGPDRGGYMREASGRVKLEDRDWTLGEFIRTTDGTDPRNKSNFRWKDVRFPETLDGSDTPEVRWRLLHPDLPIFQVKADANHWLPLIQAGLDPDEPAERIGPEGNQVRKSPRGTWTKYSVSFVVAFQHRWASFNDPNRHIIRFREQLEPYEWQPQALDPELPYPNYWDDTDFMHHSIIGPVVMTVHDSGVLERGTYSRVPRATRWEAPGHILTDEQVGTASHKHRTTGRPCKGLGEDLCILRTWPDMQHPNPGFPLPGHVMVSPHFGPGTEAWREAGMDGNDW